MMKLTFHAMPWLLLGNQRTCVVDGRTHNDGAVFTTPRICGLW